MVEIAKGDFIDGFSIVEIPVYKPYKRWEKRKEMHKTCPICGKKFKTKKNKVFCSNKCRLEELHFFYGKLKNNSKYR